MSNEFFGGPVWQHTEADELAEKASAEAFDRTNPFKAGYRSTVRIVDAEPVSSLAESTGATVFYGDWNTPAETVQQAPGMMDWESAGNITNLFKKEWTPDV